MEQFRIPFSRMTRSNSNHSSEETLSVGRKASFRTKLSSSWYLDCANAPKAQRSLASFTEVFFDTKLMKLRRFSAIFLASSLQYSKPSESSKSANQHTHKPIRLFFSAISLFSALENLETLYSTALSKKRTAISTHLQSSS